MGAGRELQTSLEHYQAGRHQEAVAAAEAAIAAIRQETATAAGARVQATEPKAAIDLLNQSLEHARAGRFRECIDTATEAANLDPNSAPAFLNIGFCSASLQLWDEGIRHTEEAIRLDPTSQLARNNLAWMQQQKPPR